MTARRMEGEMPVENFKDKEAYRNLPAGHDKEQYLVWLAARIAEQTATFPKFRRTSRFAVPMSHRRMALYRGLLDEIFGNTCNLCGQRRQLDLAHLYYAKDSVTWKTRSAFYRVREALEHPQRFFRLCGPCHVTFDQIRRCGGSPYLRRLISLIRHAKELEEIECR